MKLRHRSMPDLITSRISHPKMQLHLITSSSSRKSSSRRDNWASISASTFFCCSTSSLNLFWDISSVSVSVKIRLQQEHREVSSDSCLTLAQSIFSYEFWIVRVLLLWINYSQSTLSQHCWDHNRVSVDN